MPQKSFEERLRDKAEEFSPTPRAGLWDGIEEHLLPEKRKKRPILMVFMLAALLLVSSALLYMLESHDTGSKSAGIMEEEHIVNSKKPVDDKPEEIHLSPEEPTPGSVNKAIQKDHVSGYTKKSKRENNENNHRLEQPTEPEVARGQDQLQASADRSQQNADPHTGKMNPVKSDPSGLSDIINSNGEMGITPLPGKTESITEVSGATANGTVAETALQNTSDFQQAKDASPVTHTDTPPKENPGNVVKKYTAKKPKFYVELIGMRTLSGSMVNIDKSYKDSISYKEQVNERKKLDRETWSTDIGLLAGISGRRYDLFAGINYRELAYKMYVVNTNSSIMRGASTIFPFFDFNATDTFTQTSGKNSIVNSLGGPPPTELAGQYVTNRFRYVSIPFGINYHIKNKGNFTFGCAGMFEPQFLIEYEGLFYQNESGLYVKEKSAVENHIRKTNLSFSGALDFNYKFSQHSSVFLRPSYGLSLFPAEKAAVRTSHKFFALGAGYRFTF